MYSLFNLRILHQCLELAQKILLNIYLMQDVFLRILTKNPIT